MCRKSPKMTILFDLEQRKQTWKRMRAKKKRAKRLEYWRLKRPTVVGKLMKTSRRSKKGAKAREVGGGSEGCLLRDQTLQNAVLEWWFKERSEDLRGKSLSWKKQSGHQKSDINVWDGDRIVLRIQVKHEYQRNVGHHTSCSRARDIFTHPVVKNIMIQKYLLCHILHSTPRWTTYPQGRLERDERESKPIKTPGYHRRTFAAPYISKLMKDKAYTNKNQEIAAFFNQYSESLFSNTPPNVDESLRLKAYEEWKASGDDQRLTEAIAAIKPEQWKTMTENAILGTDVDSRPDIHVWESDNQTWRAIKSSKLVEKVQKNIRDVHAENNKIKVSKGFTCKLHGSFFGDGNPWSIQWQIRLHDYVDEMHKF